MSWDENSFLTGIAAGRAMKGVSVLGRSPRLIGKTVTENGTYFAEDDGADGYDSVTVNVSGAIEHWDFTSGTPTVGTIRGWHNLTVGNVSFDSSGAVFDNTNANIQVPLTMTPRTYEIAVGSMNLTSGTNRRFLTMQSSLGLVYRSTGKWGVYWGGSWYMTEEADGSFFANSVVKLFIDDDFYWHIYKNGVLWFEPARAATTSAQTLSIGSTSYSINNAAIESLTLF